MAIPGEYTITFDGRGGTDPSPQTTTIQSLTHLPTSIRTGYVFQGWYTAIFSGTEITTSTEFFEDTTVYAQWKRLYNIIWEHNDGTGLWTTTQEHYNVLPTLPPPERVGYDFIRWEPTIVPVTEDTTYTAIWNQKTYTVRFKNWNGMVLESQTVSHGSSATAPADPTRPQTPGHTYTFSGWNKAFTNVTQNLDITATYTSTPRKYTITWIRNDGTGLLTTTQEYYGLDPIPPQFEKTGYTLGWTPKVVPVIGEATYTASWTLIEYTITFSDTKGNTATRDTSLLQDYKVNPLPPASADGFIFQGWYTGTSGGTKITESTVFSKNTIVYARWIPVGYRNITSNDVGKIFWRWFRNSYQIW